MLPAEQFAAALGKREPTNIAAKRAHQLLNYDPTSFLAREFPTREALIFAVYKAHDTERHAVKTLESWYQDIEKNNQLKK